MEPPEHTRDEVARVQRLVDAKVFSIETTLTPLELATWIRPTPPDHGGFPLAA